MYYYANGDIYSGAFKAGKKHGSGQMFFKVRALAREQAASAARAREGCSISSACQRSEAASAVYTCVCQGGSSIRSVCQGGGSISSGVRRAPSDC